MTLKIMKRIMPLYVCAEDDFVHTNGDFVAFQFSVYSSCFVQFQLFRLPLSSVTAFVPFLKSAIRSRYFVETESILQ
jgi:hypothetical protein